MIFRSTVMPFIRKLSNSPKHHAHTHSKFRHSNKWQRFYGTKVWRDLREQKLMEQPLCERCLDNDKVTPATDVHHVCVFGSCPTEEEMWQWFLNYDNLMSLCKHCHNEIHNKHLRNYIYYYPFPYEEYTNKEVTI